jgi:hypothetical protein
MDFLKDNLRVSIGKDRDEKMIVDRGHVESRKRIGHDQHCVTLHRLCGQWADIVATPGRKRR